jgi:hypothetical protein
MAKSQLNLPTQAEPVIRYKILPVFMVTVERIGPEGRKKISFIPDVSPRRNTYSPFSREVDQRVGICPVLSAYAVAQCFRAGGLF